MKQLQGNRGDTQTEDHSTQQPAPALPNNMKNREAEELSPV